jgi:peptidyl-dipeptidase Dcp
MRFTDLKVQANDTLQAVQKEMAPKFSELKDAKYLNDKLFYRIKNLYNTI